MFRCVLARHRITPSYIHSISFKSNFAHREGFFFFFGAKNWTSILFIGKGHFLQKCLVRIQILFPQQLSLLITWGLFWFLLWLKHISEAQADNGVEEAYEWAYPLRCAEPTMLNGTRYNAGMGGIIRMIRRIAQEIEIQRHPVRLEIVRDNLQEYEI